jgi:hypothetical protein
MGGIPDFYQNFKQSPPVATFESRFQRETLNLEPIGSGRLSHLLYDYRESVKR